MTWSEFQRVWGDVDLPTSFTLLAFFTFGVTGALVGMRRGYDFIGVVFLAMITAGGGGLIRDGLLLSQGPASILTDSRYMVVVLVAAIVTRLFHGHVHRLNRTIAVIDAIGLGAFAVIGVDRSIAGGLSIPAAILGGTLTAVGGGLMRDVLVRDEPLLFKPGQFYALVAMAGCALYAGQIHWALISRKNAAIVTITAVFAVRLLAIRFNWRTTAWQRSQEQPPEQPAS